MSIPVDDLKRQYAGIRDDVERAVQAVLASGEYALGPAVEAFEEQYAA